jgi:hypothetical protein
MSMTRSAAVYMTENVFDHLDKQTNEINSASLAEDCASQLDYYEGYGVPDWLFEIAVEIAEIVESELKDGRKKSFAWEGNYLRVYLDE